jgi:hypothetical protein
MSVNVILEEAALDIVVRDIVPESSHNPIQALVHIRGSLALGVEPVLFVIQSDITKVSHLTKL